MNRKAVYPGSFDPITKGHEDLIHRSLGFVDHIEAMPVLCANAAYRADGCGNGALVLEFRLDVALVTRAASRRAKIALLLCSQCHEP